MFIVYILRGKLLAKYYIGHTEDLITRLNRHNKGLVRSTKKFVPWVVVHTEAYNTRQEAYKRELQIKRYKGGQAFKRLIKK